MNKYSRLGVLNPEFLNYVISDYPGFLYKPPFLGGVIDLNTNIINIMEMTIYLQNIKINKYV